MILKILVLMLAFGSLSFAHLQIGVYSGVQSNGQACQFNVKSVYYVTNVAHPLNERVDVEVNKIAITLQHPPIISSEKKMAYFNHDMFQGILPTQQGAMAFELKVAHQAPNNRDVALPTEFHLIQHQYKNDLRSSIVCVRLQKTR